MQKEPRGLIRDPFKDAIKETQWCLGEAYKEAVRVSGITDWSSYEQEDRVLLNRHVESMQIEIAKIIQTALHS
jgi:hypothetical protein